MANEPLKSRAGKNHLPFLNAFGQISNQLRKLSTKEFVLLENTENRRLIVSQFATACRIFNGATDALDAELYLEDSEGNRALMSVSAGLASGAAVSLAAKVGMLAQGEKLVLVISSAASILTADGVWAVAGATIPPAPNGECTRRDVTSTTLLADCYPPGGDSVSSFGAGAVVTISNFSAAAPTVAVYCVTDEGEFLVQSAVALPANEVTALTPFLAPGAQIKLVFSALPGTGYLTYNQDYILPIDAFDAEPFAE